MQPRDVRTTGRDQILLDHEIVRRAARARSVAGRVDLIDRVVDTRAQRLRHDAALDDHHGGRLVDLGQPEKPVARNCL
jgi:hypothetical protein